MSRKDGTCPVCFNEYFMYDSGYGEGMSLTASDDKVCFQADDGRMHIYWH